MKKLTIKVDIMNKKINAICFVLLLFFLISAVSAVDDKNETLQQIQPDSQEELCTIDSDNLDELKATSTEKQPTSGAVKEKVSISAPNVKMYYKDGSKFKVTLKDSKKKAIKNVKIKISINGVDYNKVTDSKGTA